MEEIVTVNGQQYILKSSTPLTQAQRIDVIRQLSIQTTGCSSCGDNNSSKISTLATCPAVNVGATKTLTATDATKGIAPYTYDWLITKPDATTDTRTGQTPTYQFSVLGDYTVKLTVTDSCTGTKIPFTDTCTFTSQIKAAIITGCATKCSGATCALKYTETCLFTIGCTTDNDGNIACPTPITWSSTDTTVATVSNGPTPPAGTVTALSKTGSTTITATSGGKTSNLITVNVSATECITPTCSFTITIDKG